MICHAACEARRSFWIGRGSCWRCVGPVRKPNSVSPPPMGSPYIISEALAMFSGIRRLRRDEGTFRHAVLGTAEGKQPDDVSQFCRNGHRWH